MDALLFTDDAYPELLKDSNDPPEKLFYKGSLDPSIFDRCLAVVGSRKISRYGVEVTKKLVGEVAGRGITIVSGFMYGADAEAHKAALSVGGRTIAVMPCGIDAIHPSDQEDLYKEILNKGGLVFSEYEGEYPAQTWTFPKRNRIVAGLSQATLVVQAGEKSGSLITADITFKNGRKVFTPPHELLRPAAGGMRYLLENGAELVMSSDEILRFFGTDSTGSPQAEGRAPLHQDSAGQAQLRRDSAGQAMVEGGPLPGRDKLEERIIECLEEDAMDVDTLRRRVECSAQELGTALSMLELDGFISEKSGKYYVN